MGREGKGAGDQALGEERLSGGRSPWMRGERALGATFRERGGMKVSRRSIWGLIFITFQNAARGASGVGRGGLEAPANGSYPFLLQPLPIKPRLFQLSKSSPYPLVDSSLDPPVLSVIITPLCPFYQ